MLNGQTQLEMLNLSFNMIHHLRRTLRSLHAVPSIRRLWLDYNPLEDFCDQRKDPVTADDVAPLRLQHMSLVGINISRLCFGSWGSLYTLNLTANNIEELLVRKKRFFKITYSNKQQIKFTVKANHHLHTASVLRHCWIKTTSW